MEDNNKPTTGKDLFQEISDLEKRKELLRDNAYRSELMEVTRKYTPEELEKFKANLATNSVEVNKEQERLKELTDQAKARMKPMQQEIKDATKALRMKSWKNKEDVFLMDDQERGVMDIFDGEGNYLHSRRLYEDERQNKMFTLNSEKTGTDNV